MLTDDLEEAEFWGLEIATAPAPAGPADQVQGIQLLCDRILVPQGRFEEASLYCTWALTLSDAGLRARARQTMDSIDLARVAAGTPRLEHHGEWRFVDLNSPGVIGQPQRDHYLRLIAFFQDMDANGHFDEAESIQRDNFMSWLTGYFLAFVPEVASVGVERETVAKAMADWFEMR